jgi:hypothetical protein
LDAGVRAATHDIILVTDADCRPAGPFWVQAMINCFDNETDIVLGFSPYANQKGLLNKIIRFETLYTAFLYGGMALIGMPYMGVGRNMAYKKEEFFNVNGFIDHMKIRSGDDDLFINQSAKGSNTTICCSPESFTYSKPKTTFKKWFLQKRRHISAASYYKSFDKMQLFVFHFSQVLFFVLPILLLLFQFQWIIVTSLIGFRYLFTWLSLGFSAGKLKEKDVMYWFPIIEIVLIFTQLNIFITNIYGIIIYTFIYRNIYTIYSIF